MTNRGFLTHIHDDIEFYDHQLSGVRQMARMGSFILADEMGLGKSLQALTVAAIDFEKGWAERVLVVCPASLKWNWSEEIEKHTSFTTHVLEGVKAKREFQLAEFRVNHTEFLIVNYEQVIGHLEDLNDLAFDIVFFDEAHMLKTPKAKRTKACLKLNAPRSFMITGSPVLNQANELWSLLHRCDAEDFPNYWRFCQRYCKYGGFQAKQIVGVKNERELRAVLDTHMIRRTKDECLDLPDKQHIQMWVDLSSEQRTLYDEVEKEMTLTTSASPDPMEIENVLTKFLRLKQIAGTTATVDPGTDHSAKLDAFMDMLPDLLAGSEKLVVFTQFRAMQQALFDRLTALTDRPAVWSLTGDTPMKERQEVVTDWGEIPGPSALVAMIQVAGVGLNMTAASTCVFLDKLFVPKLNEQAEDRIHRIGADETKPIQIVEILARKTVEQRIESILKKKRELFDGLVGDTAWKEELVRAVTNDEEYVDV